MQHPKLSVLVIGGGIGGLAAALALLQCGVDVQVFEQAGALAEAGAGVQISPNASRLLLRIGLGPSLARWGVKPLAWHQRRWDSGETLLRTPLAQAMEAAFGFPHYQMHRADLLDALAAALPAERLHLGHRLIALDDAGSFVEASFDNGARHGADVLVGADGIHSAVRREMFGREDARFTGCVAYRGLVPAERLRHLDLEVSAQVWMGPGKHVVHYFVRDRQLVNFVAVVERSQWRHESWTSPVEVADVLAAFAGWHPQVQGILAAADHAYQWALLDRQPMPRWSRGRVTLLGDACHAMLPMMAQGAAQAIEDGAALAACLRRCAPAEVPTALRRYEGVRLPRTAKLQALSAANKTRFHLPDGDAQRRRDAEMALGRTDWSPQAVAWLYGQDAAVLPAAGEGRPAGL